MRRSGSSCSSSTSPRSSFRRTNTNINTNTQILSMSSNSSTFSALPQHNTSSTTSNSTTTNLQLGLSINSGLEIDEPHDDYSDVATLFVKVYMEGHPIGRKLDILAQRCYPQLISTLDHMFNANILWAEEVDAENCEDFHVLTYEDEEGDWLMIGDVPWEMFLSTVKRLKITRACPS